MATILERPLVVPAGRRATRGAEEWHGCPPDPEEPPVTVLIPACADTARLEDDAVVDEAELAAAAFLARYGGRALDAYRSDCVGSSSGRLTPGSKS